ncbi:hypothetical protein LPE509_00687 [Legionella pneumophila subsp. pneumophila LPE509]|nr:hypothetical protein LPE509_00687 [Legionella pneumophila subsp. pneumophila LPE509]
MVCHINAGRNTHYGDNILWQIGYKPILSSQVITKTVHISMILRYGYSLT